MATCHTTGLQVPECSCPECLERLIALHEVTLIEHGMPTSDEVIRHVESHPGYLVLHPGHID
jgi:hypothetical protein